MQRHKTQLPSNYKTQSAAEGQIRRELAEKSRHAAPGNMISMYSYSIAAILIPVTKAEMKRREKLSKWKTNPRSNP